MSKKKPTAPDPVVTAAAQTQTNKDTALYNAGLNRIDQFTPYGSSEYTYSGVDASGVPKYSQQIKLTALGQANLDNQQKQDAQLSSLGFGLADQAKASLAKPLGDFTANRNAAQKAYYARATADLDPRFANEQHDLQSMLTNQGVQQNSEAWNRAYDEFGRTKNAAYENASNDSITRGGEEQARAQALAAQLRSQPLNELNALRSGTQVTNPTIAAAGQSNAQTTDYAGLVQNQYNNQLASYNNSVTGFYGFLGAAAGAAGTAASGGAASDIRLKERIVRVGTTPGGIPTYLFSYIGSAMRHLGVMAQDVLKVRPEAVVTMPNGYYAVRYDMVP